MIHFADAVLTLVLLSVLFSLSSHRLMALVKIMAFQGFCISLVPFFLGSHEHLAQGLIFFPLIIMLVKAVLIPAFIYFAVKKVSIQREVEPIIGYHASIFIGLLLIVFSAYISTQIGISRPSANKLLLPTAITTLASGLFLLMARRKAITQVIGYLLMENGIYLVGFSLSKETYSMYVVEFGILLDLLVGIMVMGIVLLNINRTFDDIDTSLMINLKD